MFIPISYTSDGMGCVTCCQQYISDLLQEATKSC